MKKGMNKTKRNVRKQLRNSLNSRYYKRQRVRREELKSNPQFQKELEAFNKKYPSDPVELLKSGKLNQRNEAWKKICNEYGIDYMLGNMPYFFPVKVELESNWKKIPDNERTLKIIIKKETTYQDLADKLTEIWEFKKKVLGEPSYKCKWGSLSGKKWKGEVLERHKEIRNEFKKQRKEDRISCRIIRDLHVRFGLSEKTIKRIVYTKLK